MVEARDLTTQQRLALYRVGVPVEELAVTEPIVAISSEEEALMEASMETFYQAQEKLEEEEAQTLSAIVFPTIKLPTIQDIIKGTIGKPVVEAAIPPAIALQEAEVPTLPTLPSIGDPLGDLSDAIGDTARGITTGLAGIGIFAIVGVGLIILLLVLGRGF